MDKGVLYIVAGPSGSGKTSLVKALINPYDPFVSDLLTKDQKYFLSQNIDSNLVKRAVTHTTRNSRGGEKNGIDYYFVNNNEFEELIKKDGFIEYARVFDKSYGTSKKEIESHIENGQNVILIVDWQGHDNIRRKYTDPLHSIFILPPSIDNLKQRLINRKEDNIEKINKRLETAQSDMEKSINFDSVIKNHLFFDSVLKMEQQIKQVKLDFNKKNLKKQSLS